MLPDNDEFFYWDSKDGRLDSTCKECRKASSRQWIRDNAARTQIAHKAYYQRNREEIIERTSNYGKNNREAVRAAKREYRERNKERIKEQKRQYYQDNHERIRAAQNATYPLRREKVIAYHREYSKNNREKIAADKRAYAQQNRERIREYKAKWRAQNRVKVSTWTRNYKLRKRNALGTHTAEDIQLQIRSQTDKKGKLRCWWCAKVIPAEQTYHVDHVIPLSRGGSNAPENLCISCAHCNLSKFNHLPQEWKGRLF